MIYRIFIFSLIAAMLVACIDIADRDQVKNQPTDQLCEDYYFVRHPAPGTSTNWPTKQADIKSELDKRQAISPGEWPLIEQNRVEMGMGECALKASWGFPMGTTHKSTENGTLTHYIYSITRYADVTEGKVSGFRY